MVLEALQRHPGTDRDLARDAVDLADLGQPAQAEHDLIVPRCPAAGHPGMPSLGNDGGAGSRARAERRSHLRGGSRAHDEQRATAEAPGEIVSEGCRDRGVRHDVLATDDAGKLGCQLLVGGQDCGVDHNASSTA